MKELRRTVGDLESPRSKLDYDALLYGFFENIESENTKKAYRADLKEFFKRLKVFALSDFEEIKIEHAVNYKNYLKRKDLTDNTLNRKLASISSFFEYLWRRRVVSENPFRYVERKRIDKVSHTRALLASEVELVLNVYTGDSYKDLLYQAILTTFFKTGIRKSELINLKTSDLVVESGRATIKILEKGGKKRVKEINLGVLESITLYLEKRIDLAGSLDGYLFVSERNLEKGSPISKTLIDYIFNQAGEISGVGRITPHMARASYISNLLNEGVPMHQVAKIVGHRDIQTTFSYTCNYCKKIVENSF